MKSRTKIINLATVFLILLSILPQYTHAQTNTLSDSSYFSDLKETIKAEFEKLPSFHGLVIYDLDNNQHLLSYEGHKYFTPASNVKLLSYMFGLMYLDSLLPSIKYVENGDSLIFWGQGDPTFLHPYFRNDSILKFLSSTNKKIFFSTANYQDKHLGEGWAWDDYVTDFSIEKSPLPIYGNEVSVQFISNCELEVHPKIFINNFYEKPHNEGDNKFSVRRELQSNTFYFQASEKSKNKTEIVPFHTTTEMVVKLLSDTLHKEIFQTSMPIPSHAKTICTFSAREVYARMLKRSDNFLAEQILLMVSEKVLGYQSTEDIIEYLCAKKKFKFLREERWVDGSGLSRYNLLSPNCFIEVLKLLYSIEKKDTLFSSLAIGGEEGTLSRRYISKDPYIFAKTGTLSNNHNLSGYIKTKKGRIFAFSFMNNHYMESSGRVADRIEKILTKIHKER